LKTIISLSIVLISFSALAQDTALLIKINHGPIPNDSLRYYAVKLPSEGDTMSFGPNWAENFPTYWLNVSNTDIGLVITEFDNRFNHHKFLPNDTIEDHQGFETYQWAITSINRPSELHFQFICAFPPIENDDSYFVYEFEILDTATMLTRRSKSLYEHKDSATDLLLYKITKLMVPASHRHLFYYLLRPKRKLPGTSYKTIKIDWTNLKLPEEKWFR
jgi:hypothetical protein